LERVGTLLLPGLILSFLQLPLQEEEGALIRGLPGLLEVQAVEVLDAYLRLEEQGIVAGTHQPKGLTGALVALPAEAAPRTMGAAAAVVAEVAMDQPQVASLELAGVAALLVQFLGHQ